MASTSRRSETLRLNRPHFDLDPEVRHEDGLSRRSYRHRQRPRLVAVVEAIVEPKAKKADELIFDHLMRALATINI